MNILLLTHRLPYAPNRGDRARAYFLMRFLSARYDVHLVSLVHDKDEAAKASSLSSLLASVSIARCNAITGIARGSLAFLGGKPLTHAILDSAAIRKRIEWVVSRYPIDVVVAYCSSMARFALEPPLLGRPFILDMVDIDSQKWRQYAERSRALRRWIYFREARCLGKFEAHAARSAFATLVVNKRELRALAAVAPDVKAIVVPNGVDIQELGPTTPPPHDDRILFCGVMNYRPNDEGMAWFITEVWPRIHTVRPKAVLTIVGPTPSRRIRRLAASAGQVEVTGYVEDVQPFYRRSAVFVAPLHLARGVQTKVLDATAAGLPSVITSAVHDGLPAEIERACLVADDPAGFATAVIDLLGRTLDDRQALVAKVDLKELSWSSRLANVPSLIEAAAHTSVCVATAP
jgi:sugar transferase (PEP-CTERM/EpsH1 system associated)